MLSKNYKIIDDGDMVNICYKGECDFFKAFIDIYPEKGPVKSPFKDVEDARLFAEIIVKLLTSIQMED